MSRVPVESTTDLKTCSTATIAGAPESDIGKALVLIRRHFISALSSVGTAGLLGSAALAAPGASAQEPTGPILIMGDSLSAEYGLRRGEGWVALLERRLADEKIRQRIVNASISGETSAGGRSRLDALLRQHKPSTVVIELGANDALRGLPVAQTEANLLTMVKASQGAGAKVLLVGIQVPPNYGTDYLNRFAQVFENVGTAAKVPVVPFLLRGVADGPDAASMFQADRIHPVAAAQPRMLDNVWPALRKLIG
ncbi:MAG: arylesterase [Comamonadaceae bacterium]|nr:MAG: arylesterase [Comamonadaceae bacterium]